MSADANKAILDQAVAAFNLGDLDGLGSRLTGDFFGYAPQPGEQTAPEAFRQIAGDLWTAFPDVKITLGDVTADGDDLRGRMTLRGKFTGQLWRYPGDGRAHSLAGTVVARFDDGRLAVRWEALPLIPFLREMGVVAMPEKAHLKPEVPVSVPEIILRLAFNGMRLQEKECSHLGMIQVREPATDVCQECVASGDEWPALRMCLICGYVGCCDLAVNQHMTKHCEETGHPIIRSIAPGESWLWCYPDAAFLASRHLYA